MSIKLSTENIPSHTFNGHIAKPIDANEIQDIIASILPIHREKNI